MEPDTVKNIKAGFPSYMLHFMESYLYDILLVNVDWPTMCLSCRRSC